MRRFVILLGVVVGMGWAAIAPVWGARPNVLLILTDDQGFGDIGSHGNPVLKTPHLDALADSGARFERFYVSPVCAPTRASLLTGRYHLRTGVCGVTRGYEHLRSEEVTLAEILRDAGYATGCFGKWHNGRHMPLHPNGQGFEEFLGFCGGHWNTYFDPPLEHNGQPVERRGYIADVLTDEALRFIEQPRGGQPWFCYLAYNTPHSPWRVPDEHWEKFSGLGLDEKAQCASAMVDNLDGNIGRLLARLSSQGLDARTIVLFLTDNGANSPRYNAGMKGYKGSVDEGGVRVPLFVRYPGVVAPGTVVRPIAAHIDLLPTLAELCGVELTAEHRARLDGRSLVPLLTSAAPPDDWPQRMLFTDSFRADQDPARTNGAVRTDRWRAVRQRGRWELFDLQADPGQERNVAAAHPEVLASLQQAFDAWLADVTAVPPGDPTIPVGHPARESFVLPANEAFLHPGHGQGIAYTGDGAAGFANCWIKMWTSTAASISWDIDVLAAGRYVVSLQQTCRAGDVGCRVELTIAPDSAETEQPAPSRITILSARVTDALDPPLLKKPDRIHSDNYQDKAEWGELPLGEVLLSSGRHTLTLRLVEKPGERGPDVKSLTLHRQP